MKESSNTPYSPEYPTISGDFNKRQYTRQGLGVHNVTVDRKETNINFQEPNNDRARARRTYQQKQVHRASTTPFATYGTKNRNRQFANNKISGKATLQGVSMAAQLNAKIIYSWTGFIYFTFQILLAIVSLISLAAATVADQDGFFGSVIDAVSGVVTFVAELMGFELIDWQVLFFIPTLSIIFIALLSYAFAGIQFKLGGAHPFYGETGNSSKQSWAMAGFVLYAIPGLNLFPWIWFWVHAVSRNPK